MMVQAPGQWVCICRIVTQHVAYFTLLEDMEGAHSPSRPHAAVKRASCMVSDHKIGLLVVSAEHATRL